MAVAHRQRVTFHIEGGDPFTLTVPSMAAKWRLVLLHAAEVSAYTEGLIRHRPTTFKARQLVRLFTDRKAEVCIG
jgi:hypothetical protein